MVGRREETTGGLLDEGEGVALGVTKGEIGGTGAIFQDRVGCDFPGKKKFAHAQDVGCREGDFGEEIVRRATGDLLEFDALTAVHRETRTTDAETTIVAGRESEKLAVEGRGGMKICRVQADVGDAGNGRAGLCRGGERGVK